METHMQLHRVRLMRGAHSVAAARCGLLNKPPTSPSGAAIDKVDIHLSLKPNKVAAALLLPGLTNQQACADPERKHTVHGGLPCMLASTSCTPVAKTMSESRATFWQINGPQVGHAAGDIKPAERQNTACQDSQTSLLQACRNHWIIKTRQNHHLPLLRNKLCAPNPAAQCL